MSFSPLRAFVRAFGSRAGGDSFPLWVREMVWRKAEVLDVDGYQFGSVRRDARGDAMLWGAYGKTDSQFGWEIDHIYPVSHGGTDELTNLQPLQWKNNRRKSDALPGQSW